MSATIDTTLFSSYFNECPIIEVPGRAFPVQEYYLEDCIQLTNFMPPPDSGRNKKNKKNRNNDDDDDGDEMATGEDDTDLSNICSNEYGPQVIFPEFTPDLISRKILPHFRSGLLCQIWAKKSYLLNLLKPF